MVSLLLFGTTHDLKLQGRVRYLLLFVKSDWQPAANAIRGAGESDPTRVAAGCRLVHRLLSPQILGQPAVDRGGRLAPKQ